MLSAMGMSSLARADTPNIGSRVDHTPYGRPISGNGWVGVEWIEPREVYEVQLIVPERERVPPIEELALEWWASAWPNIGAGGWLRMDDPWNGHFVRPKAEVKAGASPNVVVFTLPGLTTEELKSAPAPKDFPGGRAPEFRETLKIRMFTENGLPAGARLATFSRAIWKRETFDIECRSNEDGRFEGSIEITNGELVKLTGLPEPRRAMVEGTTWSAEGHAGTSAGVRLEVFYADDPNPDSNAFTLVTVRSGSGPRATGFSFIPQDVIGDGVMRVPSLGVLVSPTSRGITLANDGGPSEGNWERTIRRRIPTRPEVTRASSMAGIPRLERVRETPIGVPSARQEFYVEGYGNWSMWRESLHTAGRDVERSPFRASRKGHRRSDAGNLLVLMDTRATPRFDGGDRESAVRHLDDDQLPVVHSRWRTGPVNYHMAHGSTILLGEIGDDVTRLGDETVVLLSRLSINNTSDKTETAHVHLQWSHDAPMALRDDGAIAIVPEDFSSIPEKLTATRGIISVDKPAGGGAAGWRLDEAVNEGHSSILHYQTQLQPGQTRTVYFKTPFVDLLDQMEMDRLREISYEQEIPRVLAYWRDRIAGGMTVDIPEPALEHFYNANLWHNIITTDRDPKTKLYNQFVGTIGYMVFANETVMVARSMDMRGEHVEAERYFEPMLHFQGSEALTGRFSTQTAAFHGAGEYTHGRYAMNHGFVMWGVAEHYLFTRDRGYLERVAPKLIQAFDFLINERQSTMAPGGRDNSRVHGLAPACALEDVTEFKYWYATNGYYYLGMKRVAEALADIDHPEADRLAREAESFRQDLIASVREATTRAAAVRLLDGNYVPFVPSRAYAWQHLRGGWIREALYCSLHLVTTEVLDADDPLMTWMLEELEDNVFLTGRAGYPVQRERDKQWLELGGVTKQPCLLDMPTVYMARDEIPAALRAFWNTYSLLIYPDIHCFAEWAPHYGNGGGPLYKTSDESRFVMWMRQLMIWEDGDTLRLGRALPKVWLEDGKAVRIDRAPTFYGMMSMAIESETAKGRISATVTPPGRNPPAEIWLRLRHPSGQTPQRVFINDQPLDRERVVGQDIRILGSDSGSDGQVHIVAVYTPEG